MHLPVEDALARTSPFASASTKSPERSLSKLYMRGTGVAVEQQIAAARTAQTRRLLKAIAD